MGSSVRPPTFRKLKSGSMSSSLPAALVITAVLIGSGCTDDAAVSRDILYTSSSDPQAYEQVWRMRPDGSEVWPVTDVVAGAFESFAAWSPDGRTIAFMSNRHQADRYAIMLMDGDGSDIRQVGPADLPSQGAPAFSPDGTQIVFSGSRASLVEGLGASLDEDLYVMNVDGSDVRQLTTGEEMDRCPRWSPDGSQILFVRGNDQLRVADVRTGAVDEILPDGVEGNCGDWSPDGTQVVFTSSPDLQLPSLEEQLAGAPGGEIGLHILDLADGSIRSVPEAGQWSNYPRWSQDGRRILFQAFAPPGTNVADFQIIVEAVEIYSIGVDGSDIRRLTDNDRLDSHPNW